MSRSRICLVTINFIFLSALTTACLGCASTSDTRLGTEPGSPLTEAEPASYGADGMTFSKNQKRREANDFMFYFKHCTQNDDRSYYSRTSYWCSDP